MQDYFNISLGQLLTDCDEAYVATDAAGSVLYLNPQAQELFENQISIANSEQWDNLFTPLSHARFRESIALINSGELVAEQMFSLKIGEQYGRFLIINHPIRDGDNLEQIVWQFRYIDAVKSGNGIVAQADRYKTLFDVSVAPQWAINIEPLFHYMHELGISCEQSLKQRMVTDAHFMTEVRQRLSIIEINFAAIELIGVKNAASSDYLSFFPDRHLGYCCKAVVAIINGQSEYRFDVETVSDSGEYFNYTVISALPRKDNLVRGVLFTGFETSELKRVQRDLQARESFFSATLSSVPDLLLVYDLKNNKTRFVNGEAARHFGVTDQTKSENLTGNSNLFLHPDDHLERSQIISFLKKLRDGEVVEKNLRMKHVSGEWRDYRTRSSGIIDKRNARAAYVVTVATDVTEQQQIKSRYDSQQRNYRTLADNFSDIICTTDTELKINYISPSVEKLLGYYPQQFLNQQALITQQIPTLQSVFESLSKDFFRLTTNPQISTDEQRQYLRLQEVEVEHHLGYTVSLELQSSLMWEDDGRLQGMLILCRDITQRLQIDDDLRLAAKVFENSLQGIYITAANGTISQVNKVFTAITGYRPEEVIGRKPSFLSSNRHVGVSFALTIKPVLEQAGFWQGEVESRRKSGECYPVQVGITEVSSKHGEHIGYITAFTDETERKRNEERILKLAFYDPLTGLANRSLFHDDLEAKLIRANAEQLLLPLLFIDMDGFKAINDSMGHGAGDILLAQVGNRLQTIAKEGCQVARMGGDEFALILPDCNDHSDAVGQSTSIAQALLSSLAAPFVIQGKDVYLTASVGVAIYPTDAIDSTTLLQNADAAMYHAKSAGKNNYQYYSGMMNQSSLDKLELQNDLHRAVAAGTFELCYQPVIDLKTRRLISVEALVRWHHPQRGNIPPEAFISLAEETGLIVPLGNWVLNEACRQMAQWRRDGLAVQRVAVNISALQFSEGSLLSQVIDALDISGLPSHCLALELTESVLMEDVAYTLGMLADLKAMDVKILIDDFGTGYSSMSYLKQFPIDSLKIDRSFVSNLPDSPQDCAITNAIIAMAHSFNLSVVAEGVETEEQANYLESLGCEKCQGFLYGKPMPAQEVNRLVEYSTKIDLQLVQLIGDH
jgi:diguanylate cyclase (GGDEF)-like protein/PAS domain S-box-containing protein